MEKGNPEEKKKKQKKGESRKKYGKNAINK